MSLTTDYPVIETGDSNLQASSWRFAGFSDANTNRGRAYIKVTETAVEVYRDRDRTSLVASGTIPGSLPARMTLAQENDSGLTGSLYLSAPTITSTITVWLALASSKDMVERDRDLEEFLLDGEVDFSVVMQATMRRFLLRLNERYPPHPTFNAPLSLWSEDAPRARTRHGDADELSIYLWGANEEGDFELIGLQNPGDWREWAIQYSLGVAWDRNNRGGNEPISIKAEQYFDRANKEFLRPQPWVDVDRDQTADRPPRIRSIRLRRT